MRKIEGFSKGMGIGGWLTNYKRFNVLPMDKRMMITVGDMEHFESYITPWDAENIASFGVDHVRVGFDQIVFEEEPYKYRERIFEVLQRFVDSCRKNGLTVVLNMHKAVGNYCDVEEPISLFDSKELQNRFVALWKEFGRRYKDYDGVMFELLNEVRAVDPDGWNRLADRTIRELRADGFDKEIIVGSACWNSSESLKQMTIFDDDKVLFTFHMYDPFEFTHQKGVLQASPLIYNRSMSYPSDDIERYRDYYRVVFNKFDAYADIDRMDINFLRKQMKGAKEFIDAHPDKILWCGEFGTIRHTDIHSRENWMADVIRICKEWDIPYCVWNYLSTPNDGNRFSLVDDETRQAVSERMKEIIRGEV